MAPLGKGLVAVGLVLIVAGVAIWALPSIPYVGRLGQLPGDFYIKRNNFTLYFPLTTGILMSVVLTILFSLMRR
ncbi:MAG TPA: DUF2905 domain-containing protein [Candidatus Binataceae bacterium]